MTMIDKELLNAVAKATLNIKEILDKESKEYSTKEIINSIINDEITASIEFLDRDEAIEWLENYGTEMDFDKSLLVDIAKIKGGLK